VSAAERGAAVQVEKSVDRDAEEEIKKKSFTRESQGKDAIFPKKPQRVAAKKGGKSARRHKRRSCCSSNRENKRRPFRERGAKTAASS